MLPLGLRVEILGLGFRVSCSGTTLPPVPVRSLPLVHINACRLRLSASCGGVGIYDSDSCRKLDARVIHHESCFAGGLREGTNVGFWAVGWPRNLPPQLVTDVRIS